MGVVESSAVLVKQGYGNDAGRMVYETGDAAVNTVDSAVKVSDLAWTAGDEIAMKMQGDLKTDIGQTQSMGTQIKPKDYDKEFCTYGIISAAKEAIDSSAKDLESF